MLGFLVVFFFGGGGFGGVGFSMLLLFWGSYSYARTSTKLVHAWYRGTQSARPSSVPLAPEERKS